MPRFVYDRQRGEMVEIAYDRDLPRPPSTFPTIQRDLAPYKSPLGTGWVDGRRARREELKRSGCREVDPSEFKPVLWDQAKAQANGMAYEPPPPAPDHVRRWQADKLVQRDNPAHLNGPAPPEVRQAAAEAALRYARTKAE